MNTILRNCLQTITLPSFVELKLISPTNAWKKKTFETTTVRTKKNNGTDVGLTAAADKFELQLKIRFRDNFQHL